MLFQPTPRLRVLKIIRCDNYGADEEFICHTAEGLFSYASNLISIHMKAIPFPFALRINQQLTSLILDSAGLELTTSIPLPTLANAIKDRHGLTYLSLPLPSRSTPTFA